MEKVIIKQCVTSDCYCPNSTITGISKMDFGASEIRYYLSMCHSNAWVYHLKWYGSHINHLPVPDNNKSLKNTNRSHPFSENDGVKAL